MAAAEVGDDAYGEDPTVRALEERYAALVGKEAAVLVPSGTMANQLALRLLGRPGTTAVVGLTSHISGFEAAAAGQAAVQVVTLDDRSGRVPVAEVAWLLEAADHHWVRPSVVCIENTHMYAGGVPGTSPTWPRWPPSASPSTWTAPGCSTRWSPPGRRPPRTRRRARRCGRP
jgi:threonine aldolase